MTEILPGVQLMLLERLTLDPAIQPRWRLDERRVEEFAAAMADGIEFPPLVAFWDDTALWLSDGFHRYEGASLAELALFNVDVRLGTRRDAIRYAIEANSKHGLPLTQGDRQQAIQTLLQEFYDCTPREMTQQEIAIAVGVGQATVHRAWDRIIQMNNPPGTATSITETAQPNENDAALAPDDTDDPEDDLDDDATDTPAALGFEIPDAPEAPPEERAFYALARQRTVTRFRPEVIAAESLTPGDDLPGFHEFAQWLNAFVRHLEARSRQPLRVVE